MQKKILVCITIQENSRRLISEGFNLADAGEAPLHILHIRKGETIFDHPDSSDLLEDLFEYGSELGGEIHFLCSQDVTQTILDFIIEHEITHLVIGEAPVLPEQLNRLGIYEQLCKNLSNTHICVLSRE